MFESMNRMMFLLVFYIGYVGSDMFYVIWRLWDCIKIIWLCLLILYFYEEF